MQKKRRTNRACRLLSRGGAWLTRDPQLQRSAGTAGPSEAPTRQRLPPFAERAVHRDTSRRGHVATGWGLQLLSVLLVAGSSSLRMTYIHHAARRSVLSPAALQLAGDAPGDLPAAT